ncbi:redoxin domain-containing protein [Lentzea aerocolonigenes]|uniref:redoxin domain-containing protein n=1 Tax=Lentzea aerocolonigenes TaxID=68170 RepID=UPI0005ECF41B|nr:redoxin domain-containing protein [Lentzea aerocolonigenes]
MSVLTAAVVVVGILCLLDLLLSFGIIRRLRQQNEALRDLRENQAAAEPPIMLTAGSPVELSDVDVSGALVGFFSPNCEPCKERMPQFIEYATGHRGKVIAVAAGDADEVADMVVRLGEVAEVVVEEMGGPLHNAFGTTGYPALCLVDESRTVAASGWEMSALPVLATR